MLCKGKRISSLIDRCAEGIKSIPKERIEQLRTRYLTDKYEIALEDVKDLGLFLEVEYSTNEDVSVEKVKEVEELLGVDKSKITTLYSDEIASEIYGVDILAVKELKFKEEEND